MKLVPGDQMTRCRLIVSVKDSRPEVRPEFPKSHRARRWVSGIQWLRLKNGIRQTPRHYWYVWYRNWNAREFVENLAFRDMISDYAHV